MTQWWLYFLLCPQSGDYIWIFRRSRSLKRGGGYVGRQILCKLIDVTSWHYRLASSRPSPRRRTRQRSFTINILLHFFCKTRSGLLGLILPGVQLVRLRVNKEKRSSVWEMFWFPRILLANPTGESRNLSALTSFWAWFMICTINVSMLIISWKMDLRGWEIERKRKILKSDWRRGGPP